MTCDQVDTKMRSTVLGMPRDCRLFIAALILLAQVAGCWGWLDFWSSKTLDPEVVQVSEPPHQFCLRLTLWVRPDSGLRIPFSPQADVPERERETPLAQSQHQMPRSSARPLFSEEEDSSDYMEDADLYLPVSSQFRSLDILVVHPSPSTRCHAQHVPALVAEPCPAHAALVVHARIQRAWIGNACVHPTRSTFPRLRILALHTALPPTQPGRAAHSPSAAPPSAAGESDKSGKQRAGRGGNAQTKLFPDDPDDDKTDKKVDSHLSVGPASSTCLSPRRRVPERAERCTGSRTRSTSAVVFRDRTVQLSFVIVRFKDHC